MKIKKVSKSHKWNRYPALYNLNVMYNEIHPTCNTSTVNRELGEDYFVDSYYGRVYDSSYYNNVAIYGRSQNMDYYINSVVLDIVDELRVPFRKVPVFSVSNIDQVHSVIEKVKLENEDYEILLRGQTKPYFIDREPEEQELFYGECGIKEPSFMPSHLRHDFDEVFLESMWHSQVSMLFNDVGYHYQGKLSQQELQLYLKDTNYIRHTHLVTPFSLGIAQHYGMPSVGLDLTDNLVVANWFASNHMNIGDDGLTTTTKVDSSSHLTSMIYIFRCPKNTVFDYKVVKPKVFPNSRPDAQNAWFGHVGWGEATNQLGGYLVCAFKLTESYLNSLPEGLEEELFPKVEDDPILQFFMRKRNNPHYEGDAKKALKNIYHL
ncbi:FRG domain-containing protein [Vibrio anguillarum]|uniref:FRG domain-containing protein n=1 Tax=Vibrio anguillarum TaxID=55601 RepID=UPI0002E0A1EB|nr:hypothetical protein [Vibrio anguillarum]